MTSTQPIGRPTGSKQPCKSHRGMDHDPIDCPYPNGCTGCTCESADCPGRSYCEPCREYTVHPEQHENCGA